MIPLAALTAPDIDYAGLSPLIALTGGACVTLLLGLCPRRDACTRSSPVRPPSLTLAAATGLSIWQLGENKPIVEGALRVDDFGADARLHLLRGRRR